MLRCSASRVVVRILRLAQEVISSATMGAADSKCSKLSSTSSALRLRSSDARRSPTRSPVTSRIPTAVAIVAGTTAGSDMTLRSTNVTPSGKLDDRRAATAMASRVFPAPGGPTRLTRRVLPSSRTWEISRSSWSRGMSRRSVGGRAPCGAPRAAAIGAAYQSPRPRNS
jgi:hypothetical protein